MLNVQLAKPRLWNGRKDPYLYHVRVELLQNGKVIDCVQTGYTLNDKVIRHAKVAVGQ